jgi:hypothetical protein
MRQPEQTGENAKIFYCKRLQDLRESAGLQRDVGALSGTALGGGWWRGWPWGPGPDLVWPRLIWSGRA